MNKNQEKIYLAASILLLLIGVLCDYLVCQGFVIKTTKHLPTISVTLIQVQACLSTLIIAIIALLSGFITKSYLGIPICKYYLDIKPSIFKFKIVLLLEFLFISLSFLGQIFELYNFVICIFFAVAFVILAFIFQIYGIFGGKNTTAEEIKTYFLNRIENDNNYCINGQLFIKDWKRTIPKESLEEFESNFQIFTVLINKIITKDYDTKTVNSFLESVALFMLSSESLPSRKRGIKFVYDSYNMICNLVIDNIEIISKLNSPITLFSRVQRDWWYAINSVDEETIKRYLSTVMFKNILVLSACFANNQQNQNETSESAAVYVITKSLGVLHDNLLKNNCVIDSELWKLQIYHFDVGIIQKLSHNALKTYLHSQALLNFNICVGFIRIHKHDIVVDAIFKDWLHTIDYRAKDCSEIQFRSYILEILLIHCYAYYLGFCEDSSIVGASLQTELRDALTNPEIVKNIKILYFTIARTPKVLAKDLEQELENILDSYECPPSGSGFKECIIENVVRDYFLYLVLISDIYSLSDKHELLHTLDIDKYRFNLSPKEYGNRKEHFSNLASIFGSTIPITKLFTPLDLYLQKEIKQKRINESYDFQQKFNKDVVGNKIKTTIKDAFNRHFSKLSHISDINNDDIKVYKKIIVAKVSCYTQYLEEENNIVFLEPSFISFIDFIRRILTNYGAKIKNRASDFKTDSEFINFLKKGQYNTLIGDMSIFSCSNFSDYNEYLSHNKFISEQISIFVPSYIGIITRDKTLYIKINDVTVDISPLQISELNSNEFTIDPKTGLYEYNVGLALPLNFNQDEFQKLIQNERKSVKIYLDISVGVKDCSENKDSIIVLANEE